MLCPFQFLQKLGELFRLQGRRNPGSKKDLQNGAATVELSEWRTFADGNISLQQNEDLHFATKLLESNSLPVTNYSRLERHFPEAVALARNFVVKEVVSLLEFSREVGRPRAFKYSLNLCFSFHELMTMLEIVLSDLSPDFRVRKDILRYTRKLALNNATFHNSVGGGMFHLYMKYRGEVGGAIFSGDKKPKHTSAFEGYALLKMGLYVNHLVAMSKLSHDEREYQLQLLCISEPRQDLEDPEAVLHFLVNYFYGRERLGCPYMRGKHLVSFIDNVFAPFESY